MRQLLFISISLLIGGCTKRQSSKTTFTVDADSISNGLTDSLSHNTEKEDILALDSTAYDIDTISSSQTLNWVLNIVQNEFKGKVILSDSLILRTEFELYPLSITEIKLFVQNFAQTKYTSGEEYSIASL